MKTRQEIYQIIFGTDTPAGQRFDIVLIYLIVLSVAVVMVESIPSLPDWLRQLFFACELLFTVIFTIEYLVRVYVSPKRWEYISSFWGVIDLLTVLPGYLALIYSGGAYFMVVRLVRVLRIFRVLRLFGYLAEANVLVRSLQKAQRKILVFASFIFVLATLFGSLMYLIEGADNGFTSIPKSIYWTVVTITTVGYGDITPQTPLGQILSTFIMLTGYSIFAVPTGIVAAHLSDEMRGQKQRRCQSCNSSYHDEDARYCKHCGAEFTLDV